MPHWAGNNLISGVSSLTCSPPLHLPLLLPHPRGCVYAGVLRGAGRSGDGTCGGQGKNNTGKLARDSAIIILQTPYCIGTLVCLILNAIIPYDMEEEDEPSQPLIAEVEETKPAARDVGLVTAQPEPEAPGAAFAPAPYPTSGMQMGLPPMMQMGGGMMNPMMGGGMPMSMYPGMMPPMGYGQA